MDIIWAPWRMSYIESGVEELPRVEVGVGFDSGCFICQSIFDEVHDRERHVINRTDYVVSLLNKYPYNNGHLLIAPRFHSGRICELPEEVQLHLLREINYWVQVLEDLMQPDGFNIGLNLGHSAGAGLPGHVHWHIVPRWNGDTNFTTTISSTKVIPQSLDALWETLVKYKKNSQEVKNNSQEVNGR
ncbi:MAG: HIT domain-containing protein [Planctomycetaceae bacterium]|jgi:ATP adenylyltransferase|nr:HIT domain-containing protein [Planctomycetaceae bacterium]